MTEVSERYGRIAHGFERALRGVRDDQWGTPTPCTDWAVSDLVFHVIRTQVQVHSQLGGEPATVEETGDLLAQWRDASAEVLAALEDPVRAAHMTAGTFGEQTFESLCGRLLCADTLFHTWDLARATGQVEVLDPGAVAKALEFLTPLDDAIRRPGGFAPKIEPEPGADEQTRLLNFGGRAV